MAEPHYVERGQLLPLQFVFITNVICQVLYHVYSFDFALFERTQLQFNIYA